MKNLFSPRAEAAALAMDPVGRVMSQLKTHTQTSGAFLSHDHAVQAISLEGMGNSVVQSELSNAVSNMAAMITNITGEIKELKGLSVSQESAMIVAGMVGSSPEAITAYMSRDSSFAALNRFSNENTQVIGHTGSSDVRTIDMQAFDNRENKNAMVYSVAYNMQASRQDELGETFYPTVVVPPNEVGFMISIRVQYVFDGVSRSTTGALAKFNRKNIIKAVIDPTILRNDETSLVPVYRKTNPAAATDNDADFAADVGPQSVVNAGVTQLTSAIAVGKTVDLLGISQTDANLSAGTFDNTDSIDSSIRLKNVYVRLQNSDASTVEVFKVAVGNIAGTDFNAPPQGNTQKMQLAVDLALPFAAGQLKLDGSASTLLAGLSTNTVIVKTSIFGSVIQDKGDTVVNASAVVADKVYDATNQQLGTTAGAGAAAVAPFVAASIVGYDLTAYRTNANRRSRGQLLDTQFINYLYTVPVLPPITHLRPVGANDSNDSTMLAGLITATHVRTSNAAVTALLEAASFLKQFSSSYYALTDSPQILGVSRDLVTPAYLEEGLNVATTIDSLSTASRTDDLAALIQNKIRDMAIRMYVSSGYKAAADSLHGNAPPKPCVIIGTDQILARYLTLQGDLRLMGEAFDYKLVYSLDNRMAGKIFISFGSADSINSGVPNPLHFGNMAWKPEMTLMMPMTRGQSMVMELTVQPSFRHVNNLPILGVLTVTNIDAVVATKIAINNHVV
jgi:hypothetical protein